VRENRDLVDYRALAGRLATAALVLGAVAFVAIVWQGVQQGLSFRLMGSWVARYLVAFLVVAAVLTATHAVRGARGVYRRGDRLRSDDVGLLPRRPRRTDED
jgi:hypothetical protein